MTDVAQMPVSLDSVESAEKHRFSLDEVSKFDKNGLKKTEIIEKNTLPNKESKYITRQIQLTVIIPTYMQLHDDDSLTTTSTSEDFR